LLALATSFAWAQPKDLSGTWVAKVTAFGDLELVYELTVVDGRISGTVRIPFGDAPIVEGRVDGSHVEFAVLMDLFGTPQKVVTKGEIVGDELHLVPGMPEMPPPPGAPAGPPGGPGGRPPGVGAGAATPAGPPPMSLGVVIARRGTPSPSYRAPALDAATLPKVELPPRRDVPANGLAQTPPMGWNSWNRFHTKIDDRTVREIADAMASNGMRDAGYSYVIIDDGWQWKRDGEGVLQPNPQFPDMKALADYVHGKGLKLGIYSSPGPRTCGGYEGSYGHEEVDARTWAAWGVDYLKYDWCSAMRVWKEADMRAVYQRMGEALRSAGRPIVYGLCQYGRARVWEWGPAVGGNLWRTTGDIFDSWASMAGIGFSQGDLAPWAGPGHWNDPDMLEVGNGGLTTEEARTHFSLWSLLAAPLLAGNDVRNMDAATREILLNREVIAVDQDPLGRAANRVAADGDAEVWAKPLAGDAVAVGLFNRGSAPREVTVSWAQLKLAGARQVRDLWAHADRGLFTDGYKATVPPHGAVMIRVAK
jgi:alpha-galactosidase